MLTRGRNRVVRLRRRRARGAPRCPEHPVLRPGARVRLAGALRLLGGKLHRVIQVHAPRARLTRGSIRARPLTDRGRRRILGLELARDGLPVRRERVRLPVVERELGRRADLALGARGVTDVRQADGDLVVARGLDLRLGHAQLVDAVAHDVNRARERVRGHLRRLGAREALVDELHSALEVEAEDGLLRLDCAGNTGDDDQRADQQPNDDEQDEAISLAITH